MTIKDVLYPIYKAAEESANALKAIEEEHLSASEKLEASMQAVYIAAFIDAIKVIYREFHTQGILDADVADIHNMLKEKGSKKEV